MPKGRGNFDSFHLEHIKTVSPSYFKKKLVCVCVCGCVGVCVCVCLNIAAANIYCGTWINRRAVMMVERSNTLFVCSGGRGPGFKPR